MRELGGGTAVVCGETTVRCDGENLLSESGACERATGCVVETETTFCSFSCADAMCGACVTTDWSQTPLALTLEEGNLHTAKFVIDDEGGQHIAFPSQRLGSSFSSPSSTTPTGRTTTLRGRARSSRRRTWGGADISLAVHNGEPHIIVVVQEVLAYWHREGATWNDEVIPGRTDRGFSEIVVTDDGETHVLRSDLSGLQHLRRSGGTWTEERIDISMRFASSLRAVAQGSTIHLVYEDEDDALGYARFSGSTWEARREVVGELVGYPELSVGADGSVAIAYSLRDSDELVLASLTPTGAFSARVITAGLPQIGDEHSIARDESGGTHVVFRATFPRRSVVAVRAARSVWFHDGSMVRAARKGDEPSHRTWVHLKP